MTTPSLIDAARDLVRHFDLKHIRGDRSTKGSAAGLAGRVDYAAVRGVADAVDALPPDAVIVSRSLLLAAANVLVWYSTDRALDMPDGSPGALETACMLREAAEEAG